MKDIRETTPALPTITGIPHPVNSLLVSGRAGQGRAVGQEQQGRAAARARGTAQQGRRSFARKRLLSFAIQLSKGLISAAATLLTRLSGLTPTEQDAIFQRFDAASG